MKVKVLTLTDEGLERRDSLKADTTYVEKDSLKTE